MRTASLQTGWHGVELRHLAALQAVARERSFSAAAASLGYTQSAISGQIVALERVIGARLVDRLRGSRLVELTEEGEVLLSHAAAIAARLEAAQADIAMLRAGSRQILRVGTFETVSRSMVADVLQRLASEHPSLDVSLRESYEPDGLLDQLERGKLDLAFALWSLRPRRLQDRSAARSFARCRASPQRLARSCSKCRIVARSHATFQTSRSRQA